MIKAWAEYPQDLIEGFGEDGDLIRQYLLNPAIFALLEEVRDKRILDAGCGQGYLCRLLARKGARVTGVEPSEAFYRYVLRREQKERKASSALSLSFDQFQFGHMAFHHAIID